MPTCVALNCKHRTGNTNKTKGITFHKFPQHGDERHMWTALVRRQRRLYNWLPSKNTSLCSAHFSEDDFYSTPKGQRRLNKQARPVFPEMNFSSNAEADVEPLLEVDLKGKNSRKEGNSAEGTSTEHYTSSIESTRGLMRYSSGVSQDKLTSGSLEQELMMDMHELSDKIQNVYPQLQGNQFTFTFKGADGDQCQYVFMSSSTLRRHPDRHRGVFCNECCVLIEGTRFTCCSCHDYDICAACEALGYHQQHILMRITKPLRLKQAKELLHRWREALKTAGATDVQEIISQTVLHYPPKHMGTVESNSTPKANDKNLFVANTSDQNTKFDTTDSSDEEPLTKRIKHEKKNVKSPKKSSTKKSKDFKVGKIEKRKTSCETDASRSHKNSGTATVASKDDRNNTAEKQNDGNYKQESGGVDKELNDEITIEIKAEQSDENFFSDYGDAAGAGEELAAVKIEEDPLGPDITKMETSSTRSGDEESFVPSSVVRSSTFRSRGVAGSVPSSGAKSFCKTFMHRKIDN